jgi:aryl-alcohol dehydrogenase-like predicted oxidoreductase
VETLQPPYSLVAREVEDEILPFAEREGIGVIVNSPMGSGLLTGKMTRARIEGLADDDWRKHEARFREPQLSRHLAARDCGAVTRRSSHDHKPGPAGPLSRALGGSGAPSCPRPSPAPGPP